jgi:hypothetical protein
LLSAAIPCLAADLGQLLIGGLLFVGCGFLG